MIIITIGAYCFAHVNVTYLIYAIFRGKISKTEEEREAETESKKDHFCFVFLLKKNYLKKIEERKNIKKKGKKMKVEKKGKKQEREGGKKKKGMERRRKKSKEKKQRKQVAFV